MIISINYMDCIRVTANFSTINRKDQDTRENKLVLIYNRYI
jgi:hypothetical protein